MICPKGWLKAFFVVLWEDRGLIYHNLKREIGRQFRHIFLRAK